MENIEITQQAIEFARRNKKVIAKEIADSKKFFPDSNPISIFMAGSPGAGKTEFSKNLITLLETDLDHGVVRIDGDDLRKYFSLYNGENSYLFQPAISILVDSIYDKVLKQKQTFILDGTFSKHTIAINNIRRSLDKERAVWIFYIYQDPKTAWKFTQLREQKEGRNIPKQAFIDSFLGSYDTIKLALDEFGSTIHTFFVKKDFEKNTVDTIMTLKTAQDLIDAPIGPVYTKEELINIL